MAYNDPHPYQEYVKPLNINGLEGRVLRLPPKKTKRPQRDILLVYGHHTVLERWFSLVETLEQYGTVTMPDLPGFGGMDSFYKIGKKPTIDNFADYLAAFIKLRYRRGQITIIGISFGFVIATRMLQKYPELTKKVNLMVSMVGFMHRDDFVFKPRARQFYARAARFFSTAPIAWFIRYCCLNRFVIQTIYARLSGGKKRFIEMDVHFKDQHMDFETRLWQQNDVRTHWATTAEFLDLDNCTRQIKLPIWHVASKHDHYFDNNIVKEHMLVVFTDYELLPMNSLAHTPPIIAEKKEAAVMVPPGLRKVLRSEAT